MKLSLNNILCKIHCQRIKMVTFSIKTFFNKIFNIIDGKNTLIGFVNLLLSIYFFFLGFNALVFSPNTNILLVIINGLMMLVGISYMAISLSEKIHKKLDFILEVLLVILILINAILTMLGINTHSDPVTVTIFSFFLLGIKLRQSWLINIKNGSDYDRGNNK